MNHRPRFLIVGQGLAGTNLAFHLLSMGADVLIVDAGLEKAASLVAAGLLNPVTGPRLHLTWQADLHLQAAEKFYREREAELGIRFYECRTILRVLRSDVERQRWQQRIGMADYASFLSRELLSAAVGVRKSPFGFCRIKRAGAIETGVYLRKAREFFLNQRLLVCEAFDYQTVEPQQDGCIWRGKKFDTAIFCEGVAGRKNPWFSYLPLEPAKGEILRLQISGPLPEEVVNAGKWVIPLGNHQVRVGSTFEPGICDCNPTAAAANQLTRRATELLGLRGSPELLEHQAGVRPCSRDKLPFIGRHPKFPGLAIANGFGAKGALLSPLCTLRLARYLLAGDPLHPEEDIARWAKRCN